MASPVLKLNNGLNMPIVGLGTSESGEEVTQAVKDAIDAGYRHFDCAYFYGTEAGLGAGIRAKIQDGTVKREDIFVTSKLWNTFHSYELVVPTCKLTLQNLGLDYVDLYLIHWPMGWKEGQDMWPTENDKILNSDVDYLNTWRGMEDCVTQGLAKSIGLSNFNSEQIERILANSKIKPVNNQIEVHVYFNQKKMIEFCRSKDITVTGYSPLNRGDAGYLKDQKILEISKKYGKTPAQIVLQYLVSLGISVIPKSVTKSRIIENINIFDFELSSEEIAYLDSLNKNYKIFPFKENIDNKYYPFHIEY